MRSTIEELYYGNITPSDRSYQRSGQYANTLRLITRNEEELLKTLTAAGHRRSQPLIIRPRAIKTKKGARS